MKTRQTAISKAVVGRHRSHRRRSQTKTLDEERLVPAAAEHVGAAADETSQIRDEAPHCLHYWSGKRTVDEQTSEAKRRQCRTSSAH